MGTMGLFVVSLRRHSAIRLLSFLCLYASLLNSVIWSIVFRHIRYTIASVGLLIATVLGHSMTRVSIRLRVIVVLLFIDFLLLLIVSVVSLCRSIRVVGNVVSEVTWTVVTMCLTLQLFMLVLVSFDVVMNPLTSILPSICLFALSTFAYLLITVIRSLRVIHVME